MSLSLLFILFIAFLVLLATFAIIYVCTKNDIVGVIGTIIFAIACILIILTMISAVFAKPIEVNISQYPLDSFYKLGDGYAYSYTDEGGIINEGYIPEKEIKKESYTDRPFVKVTNNGTRKEFWFIYDESEKPDIDYVFYVESEFNNKPQQ